MSIHDCNCIAPVTVTCLQYANCPAVLSSSGTSGSVGEEFTAACDFSSLCCSHTFERCLIKRCFTLSAVNVRLWIKYSFFPQRQSNSCQKNDSVGARKGDLCFSSCTFFVLSSLLLVNFASKRKMRFTLWKTASFASFLFCLLALNALCEGKSLKDTVVIHRSYF